MEKSQKKAICDLCQKYLLEIPIMLECKKLICKECLLRIKDQNENKIKCPFSHGQDTHQFNEYQNKVIEQIREKRKIIFCQSHIEERKECNIICKECQQMICYQCYYRKHQDHNQKIFEFQFGIIENQYKKIKVEVDKLKEEFNKIYQFLDGFMLNPSLFNSNLLISQFQSCIDFIKKLKPQANLQNFIDFNKIDNDIVVNDKFNFLESTLMNKDQQNWLKEQIKTISDYKEIKLIYKGSRDGFTKEECHQNCDRQGPTISIIKSEFEKTFGGFASISWESQGGYRQDDKAFLFQLDKLTRHNVYQNHQYALLFSANYLI